MSPRRLVWFVLAVLALSCITRPDRLRAQQTECAGCSFDVSVTPDGGAPISHEGRTGPYHQTFFVTNTGGTAASFGLACSGTGGVTCSSINPSSTGILDPGEGSLDVDVTYTMGNTTGRLVLYATGSASDSGWVNLTPTSGTAPTITLAAPVLSTGSRAVVRTRQPVIRAFITGGSSVDSAATALTWRGLTKTGSARINRRVLEWEVDSVSWLGVGDSAQIAVTACSMGGACASVTRWAVLENDNKPVLGFTGTPFEALGSGFSSGFGPGVNLSGFEVETGFGTIPYFSYGKARGANLVYSTRQSYPRALIPVDLELPWPAGTPSQIKLVPIDGGVRKDSLVLANPTCATGAVKRCRAVLPIDYATTTFATPTRKWITVEASVTSGGITQMGSDSVETVLVDRRQTQYGSGWWPAGALKLVGAGADRLLIGPSGAATVFRGSGDSSYISPPGNFTVLKKVGSGWELSPRGSLSKLVFDANGRLTTSVDQNGLRDSVAYSTVGDTVKTLVDPLGKTIAFYYASGRLDSIVSLTGTAVRSTQITVDGSNRLTTVTLAPGATRPYTTNYTYTTYSGTDTYVLAKRIGQVTDTTIVSYDATYKRPTQSRLPQVQDETGTTINPVITYTAYEEQGLGSLRSLDSLYVEVKDPRNNWTRSLLNRWGQARKTWDALGVIGKTEYDPDGLVLWSEGKVADSSRTYNTYDALHRLARSFIVRAAGDTLRVDSLVYDVDHRVIKRLGARGDSTKYGYDSKGNILTVTDAAGNVSQTAYNSNGTVWKTWAPGSLVPREYIYISTWRQPYRVLDEAGTTVDSTLYDRYGRDSLSFRKIRVQVASGGTSSWQWRQSQTYYTLANEADSVLLRRTNNCVDPCNSPPAFTTTDSTAQRVSHRYDDAGRDTLRLNSRYKGTRYAYDRLGRVVARWPFADSAAVVDSMFYDVAGNLKKHRTRRGDTLTTNFDSRNRDTLSVIPTVGTLRRAFGGPLDQLTRMWLTSPVDSVGGVNGELRWGYDQRGRLKGDTSYTGTTARVTSYSYDTWERPSGMVDPVGSWNTKYETSRSLADTLITPFADTLVYAYDSRGRPIGPTVRAGAASPAMARTPKWLDTGILDSLTTIVGASTVGGGYERNGVGQSEGTAYGPVWNSSGGSVTIQDSIVYDGWERVKLHTTMKNGVAISSDTLAIDVMGNVKPYKSYTNTDLTTERVKSDSLGGISSIYSYDRDGNLVQATIGGVLWNYGFDAVNRLVSVRRAGTLIARYGYDVAGRRIAKRVYSAASGGTVAYTRFAYHGEHVAFEADSAGTLGLKYTWGLDTDDLVGIRNGANHYYVVQDKLRSIRAVYTRSGTWQARFEYRAYGAVVDSGGSTPFTLRYRWTGREFDAETGFYYFRARYYSPRQFRFIQEDPAGYSGSANMYAYADGKALEATDPSGLATKIPHCYECNIAGDNLGGLLHKRAGNGGGLGTSALEEWGNEQWGEFEIRGKDPTFTGTEAEIAVMERAWHHVQRSLIDGMRRNVPDADFVVGIMSTLLESNLDFEFMATSFGSTQQGGTGSTLPFSRTMKIDLGRIANAAYNTTVGATMIHEFGHAAYNCSGMAAMAYNSDASDAMAITFENAYRRSVGANPRIGHDDIWTPWRN